MTGWGWGGGGGGREPEYPPGYPEKTADVRNATTDFITGGIVAQMAMTKVKSLSGRIFLIYFPSKIFWIGASYWHQSLLIWSIRFTNLLIDLLSALISYPSAVQKTY